MITARLVTERKSDWVVVAGADASRVTHFAAQELRNTIERMTRTALPISNAPPTGSPVARLIDDSALPREGFRITIQPQQIEVRGNGVGVLYGVYALLERLGCRFVAPGDDCVPDVESLSLESGIIEESPDIAWRMVRLIDPPHGEDPAASLVAQVDWCAKNRINWLQCVTGWIGTPTFMGRPLWTSESALADQVVPSVLDRGLKLLVGCHAFFHWCPPAEFFEIHPEYYSLINGKRQPIQLCVTHPDVERIVAEHIIAFLDRCPEVGGVELSPMDGDDWCNCENCLRADDPPRMAGGPFKRYQSRSRSLYTFVDRVAQRVAAKHPDRSVATFAYVHYTEPPPGFTPTSTNLVIALTWYWNCATHSLGEASCETARYFMEAQTQWSKQLNGKITLLAADYHYGMAAWNLVPWPALRLSALNWKLSAPLGVNAFAFQHYKADPILYRITDYVWARFVWDLKCADQWPELLRDACVAYFGFLAGPRITEYQMLLEQRAEDFDGHLLPSAELFLTKLVNRDTYEKLDALAEEVRSLPASPIAARRISRFQWQHGLLLSVWQSLSHWVQAQNEEKRGDEPAARLHLEKTVQHGSDAMQRWPHNPGMLSHVTKAVSAAREKLGSKVLLEKTTADDQIAAKMSDLVTRPNEIKSQ